MLVSDCGLAYDPPKCKKSKCTAHLLKRRSEVEQAKSGGAVRFSRRVAAPRSVVWGEESPMPSRPWWRERAERFAREATVVRGKAAYRERSRRRLLMDR